MTRARRMSHCGDSEVPGASRTASSRARSCTCCPHPSTQRCPGRWDVTGSHCSLQSTDASVQGGATVKWSKLSCRGPCARRCRDEASDSAAEDSGCRGWWGGASRGAELPPVRGGGVGTFRAAAARSSRCCEVSPRGASPRSHQLGRGRAPGCSRRAQRSAVAAPAPLLTAAPRAEPGPLHPASAPVTVDGAPTWPALALLSARLVRLRGVPAPIPCTFIPLL